MTGIGDSTGRPVAKDKSEIANNELENPGEWTPAKRIRLKAKPLVQSKRPRETPTDLEHMENDELAENGNRQHCKQEKKRPARRGDDERTEDG